MHVLSIVTRKGGSGKSTLAAHMAVAAHRAGAQPVGLIDGDPQGTLRDWHKTRADADFILGPPGTKDLTPALEGLARSGAEIVVVDTPPSSVDAIEATVRVSDLVVVPVRPSPNDIRVIDSTARIVEMLGKPAVFVINGGTRGAQITAQAVRTISQFGPLAPVIIHNRVSVASSMIDGHTAMEVAGGEIASQEMSRLWGYIETRLNGGYRH